MRHKPDYYLGRIRHSRQSVRHHPTPPFWWALVPIPDPNMPVPPRVAPKGTYFISRIIAYRKHPTKGHQYLVRWEGFPLSESTWEPYRRLKDAFEMDEWEIRQGRVVLLK